ncbi:MAG: DUF3307 domain-containing protein [Treponema sp.]|nr:DUF3307 domain-containing protein [Treponema sp.]
MKPFILLAMLFAHIVDDFSLQGILANFKQKSWWKKHYPDDLYAHDWIISLLIHAFSWTFMIFIPVFVYNHYQATTGMLVVFVADLLVHSIIDHLKANKLCINLTTDQLLHIVQVVITFFILVR